MQPGVRYNQKQIDELYKQLHEVVIGQPLTQKWQNHINSAIHWRGSEAANRVFPYRIDHLWGEMYRGKPVKEEWYEDILRIFEWDDPRKPVTKEDIV